MPSNMNPWFASVTRSEGRTVTTEVISYWENTSASTDRLLNEASRGTPHDTRINVLCLAVAATETLCRPRPQKIIRVLRFFTEQVVVEIERVGGDVQVLLRTSLVIGKVASEVSSSDVVVEDLGLHVSKSQPPITWPGDSCATESRWCVMRKKRSR